MRVTRLHKAATALMESAIRIAPPDSREWGHAMRSELDYVEDPWGALVWAFGGASVLVRRALAALFMPGPQSIPGGAGLFARKVPIREAALAVSGACILATLIFFAAPPFRQALRTSFSPWTRMVQPYPGSQQPRLEALARRAEQRRDAAGVAFCAVRLSNSRESARLAAEAVRLDPNLLWVYAVVAVRHPDLPEIGEWLPKLERWDPQNALLSLIIAERNDLQHISLKDVQARGHENDPVWQSAMTTAFYSSRFDDYLGRAPELDRRVALRYRFYDPEAVLFETGEGLPSTAVVDCRRFASLLIRSGRNLEARGHEKRAMEEYLTVARFGQLIDSQGHTRMERLAGAHLQTTAYQQLQALSLKERRQAEASLFGYLAAKFNPAVSARRGRGEWVFGLEICKRNAAFLQLSGLLILFFSGLVVAALLILIAGRRSARRFRPWATVTVLVSGVGLLLSSATLYLTYRPYWYIFQGAILNGDRSQIRDLHDFLRASQIPLGFLGRIPMQDFPVYFWTGVIFLCVIALVLILLRQFGPHPGPDRLQHNPRML